MDNKSLESMLFGLKEVLNDSDRTDVKRKIDYKLKEVNTLKNANENQSEVLFVKETVTSLSESFHMRQKQLLTDSEIVKQINTKIDRFRSEHELKIQGLLSSLMQDIDEAVTRYSDEIIRRLDAKTIKERFHKKEDFELWLNTLNDSYKRDMEKSVDRKTQSTIRSYLMDVETVFEETTQYLANREVVLATEDHFYGSLSSSKQLITREIRNNIQEMVVYNKSLYEASEELFNGIWAARRKYDAKRYATTTAATVLGAGGISAAVTATVAFNVATTAAASAAAATTGVATAAGAAGAAGAATVGAATAATTAGAATATTVGGTIMAGITASSMPIIAGIAALVISGIFISNVAFKLSSAMHSGNLEKEVARCVEEFKLEIQNSKYAMQRHITESIRLIFDNELRSLDRTFLEFRKTTYLDEDKMPLLVAKFEAIKSEVGCL